MERKTGRCMNWSNELEIECDVKKRQWLKSYSQPAMLCDDVTKMSEGYAWNYVSEEYQELPTRLVSYVFGFSCKDLSTLNNASGPWREQCLGEQLGSTGRTFEGNLQVVARTRPWWFLMENVPGARKGSNYKMLRAAVEV